MSAREGRILCAAPIAALGCGPPSLGPRQWTSVIAKTNPNGKAQRFYLYGSDISVSSAFFIAPLFFALFFPLFAIDLAPGVFAPPFQGLAL
jgi:hypothetical protein